MADLVRLRRIAPALGLLVLAPICAEYLSGYDDSVGRPLGLLALLAFAARRASLETSARTYETEAPAVPTPPVR
jgi:hypothetical protein